MAPRPELVGGTLSYYVYDGSDVALVLARPAQGGTWWVKQRPLVGGVDEVLAGRYSAAGTQSQNLVLVADRQGSTVASVKADGSEELSTLYPGRNAFGALEGASAGGTTNTETGFTGASTPNQTGGFTYLRNRWYDPATGRFLTQDPIGLAGGVNLYAYAGNDPVAYSDPFGLCTPPDSPVCQFITGVADGVRGLEHLQPAMLAVASLPTLGVGEAAPIVLGLGGAGRVGSGIAQARALGQAGEAAAGIVKNTEHIPSATGTAAYRIPDGLTPSTLTEVKNVAKLALTNQIRDFAAIAKATGKGFDLIVRSTTEFTGSLREFIAKQGINVKFLP